MHRRHSRWRYGWLGAALAVAAGAGWWTWSGHALGRIFLGRDPLERVVTAAVRHSDLETSLTASGRVESENRTIIQCELQQLDNRGRSPGTSAGASTIISLVPNGMLVKKGDVLCTLDASDYEEMARQQAIDVERAKAEHRQAELELEVARLALQEFRDGYMRQDVEQLRGAISMAQSEYQRGADRLAWSKRMYDKGYVSLAQLTAEKSNQERVTFALTQRRVELGIFEKFTAPRTIRELQTKITAAEATLSFQVAKLDQNNDRLARLRRQIDYCTIRAPHEGILVYANDERRGFFIQEGLAVRQKQPLFYLPDLARMEVETLFHETVVQQLQKGMRADVRVEGLPGRVLQGHITKINEMATQDLISEVRYFKGIIKLDRIPAGLLPGMSALVEVYTSHRPRVLTVPAEALAIENGQEVCYVAREGSVERREVKIGQSTSDLIEVTDGLAAGEQVVIDPDAMDKDALASRGSSAGDDDSPAGSESDTTPLTH